MILQEKIKEEAEGYGKLAPAFIEGAKFALENQWISVEEDLPCNHEELIRYTETDIVIVTVVDEKGRYFTDLGYMKLNIRDKWVWMYSCSKHITHWMPLSRLSRKYDNNLWNKK